MAMSANEPLKRPITAAYLAGGAAILALDVGLKQLALHKLAPGVPYEVTGFLNFTLVFNKGAAFGLFSDAGAQANAIFIVAAIIILAVLSRIFWTLRPGYHQLSVAIALIAAGACGNLLDRFLYGQVIDFIDFHFAGWHFYTFNLADASISAGAIIFVADLLGLRVFFRNSANR